MQSLSSSFVNEKISSSTATTTHDNLHSSSLSSSSTSTTKLIESSSSSSSSLWNTKKQQSNNHHLQYYLDAICVCILHYTLCFLLIFQCHDWYLDMIDSYSSSFSRDTSSLLSWIVKHQSGLLQRYKERGKNDAYTNLIATIIFVYSLLTFLLRVTFPATTTTTTSSTTHKNNNHNILTSLYRKSSIYEQTWLCNVTLFMGSIALYTQRPLITMALCVAVSIDQLLWYVDLLGYLFSGSFPIGVAKYLTWKETSWITKYTCTHHLWTIPLFCSATKGIHPLSYLLSIVVVAVNVCLSRCFTPFILWADDEEEEDRVAEERVCNGEGEDAVIVADNIASQTTLRQRKQQQQQDSQHSLHEAAKKNQSTIKMNHQNDISNNTNKQQPFLASSSSLSTTTKKKVHKKYLNINLSHELWRDITFSILQINYDDPPAMLYILRLLWRWSFFNFLTFLFLYQVSLFVFGGQGWY